MKVLIFPTDTGQGHNCASEALRECLAAQGVDARILDVLNTGRQKSHVVSDLYDGLVRRVPRFFGALYALAERISSSERHSPIYYLNALYAPSLHKLILEMAPDVIVCPHMFSAHAVTRLIQTRGLAIPTVGIITDYSCSPFWEETRLDRYIVANPAVADLCADKGIPRGKLAPLGIPVGQRFQARIPKEQARAAFQIGQSPVFVIMGGSMGYGRIPDLAAGLAHRMPEAQVVAVCGSNASALERARAIPGVLALPYVQNVDLLMDAADVLLTKPGGLSTTEAMTKRVPLVITLPIPGGEARNSDFIAQAGMAVSALTVEAAVDAACALALDPAAQDAMLAAQERWIPPRAAQDAADLILQMASHQDSKKEEPAC